MSENMKPSGIAWIGDVPESWSVKRLKYLGVARNGLTYDPNDISDEGSIVLRSMNVQDGLLCLENIINVNMPIPQQLVLQKDDLLICSRNGSRDLIGKCALIDERAVGETYGAFMCVYRSIYNRFLYYVMQSPIFSFYLGTFLTSTINQLTNENLGNIKIAFVSSMYEQTLIADFLDKQCEKIDSTATDIEKQIDLLQKYKKSLITETVTKGLDKSVPMKDSGIDIVGDIVADWKIKRLKYLCKITTGNSDTQDAEFDGKYPFYVRSPIVESINKYDFEGEAVLMAGDGVGAGKVFHLARGKFGCHQRVYIIFDFKLVIPEYLYYFIRNFFSIEVEKGSAKSTVDSIRLPMLQNFCICFPDINEQKGIVNYLDKQCSKIDSIIESKKEQLTKITQHKKSLIYEYVTGKKRVKGENNNGN